MDDHLAGSMADLLVKLWRWAMEPGSLIVTLLATGFGAYAGGAAAFRSEREKREQDLRREEATAIDRALFTLFRFHRVVVTLMGMFVKEVEREPLMMLVLGSTLDAGWEIPRLDIAALDFLHSTQHQTVLHDLLKRDDAFQVLAALVRQRSRLVDEWVKPIAERHPLVMADGSPGFDAKAIERDLSIRQREDLLGISRQIVYELKLEMVEIPKTQQMLAAVYKAIFPDRPKPTYLSVAEPSVPSEPVMQGQ